MLTIDGLTKKKRYKYGDLVTITGCDVGNFGSDKAVVVSGRYFSSEDQCYVYDVVKFENYRGEDFDHDGCYDEYGDDFINYVWEDDLELYREEVDPFERYCHNIINARMV